jgi:hypothetical protein
MPRSANIANSVRFAAKSPLCKNRLEVSKAWCKWEMWLLACNCGRNQAAANQSSNTTTLLCQGQLQDTEVLTALSDARAGSGDGEPRAAHGREHPVAPPSRDARPDLLLAGCRVSVPAPPHGSAGRRGRTTGRRPPFVLDRSPPKYPHCKSVYHSLQPLGFVCRYIAYSSLFLFCY